VNTASNANSATNTPSKIYCDRCDRECSDGYEIHDFGRDRETGYVDQEIVCAWCLHPVPCDFCHTRHAVAEVIRDGDGLNACDSCRTLGPSLTFSI
jgi:hypothetical protein